MLAIGRQLKNGFGVSARSMKDDLIAMTRNKDRRAMAVLFLTGIIPRRAYGPTVAQVNMTSYRAFTIESGRDKIGDKLNHGALHAAAHWLAQELASTNPLAEKILMKNGNCISGRNAPDTPAGKITIEVAQSWTSEDRATFTEGPSGPVLEFAGSVLNELSQA